ncbi:uncharacterized protein N7459_001610 [Penicillium hispanicum]|uniref:uncharacterized protein n=1 Tax=Penicillium hispanicum TaxID=1080232 RepID=UPI002541F171|nr:uncharacterized protein N7459_001610 [Penicillium hispanicum]KAJ5595402.1 hypothetical protein N7459_001610 [Penicillium hispanicum]
MILDGVTRQADPIEAEAGWNEKSLEDEKAETPRYVDAFGDEANAEVKYKTMEWWQAGMFMIAESVSLGVLSLPATLAELGLAPAIVLIIGLGLLATYTGYVIGQFHQRYPHIQNLADAGDVLLGAFGRELFGIGQLLFSIFIMGSHILTFSVMMNTITEHGTCTMVFTTVGFVICMVCSLPRTMKNMTYISCCSFVSILTAVLITMIGVGIQDHGYTTIKATVDTDLYRAFTAVTNIVFAYCAHVAFFGLLAEMKNPRDFPKALYMLQTFEIIFYTVAAVVIYYYAGQSVTSPALGSAGPVLKKVAYGIAIPTIVGAGVVNGHVGLKYIYVRLFRGTDRMHRRDLFSIGSWVAIGLTCWIIAWIIADAIPVFSDLLSLIVSDFDALPYYEFMLLTIGIFISLELSFCQLVQLGSLLSRKICLTIINILIVCIGACMCGLGLYVSGKAIHDDASNNSFSCASNA